MPGGKAKKLTKQDAADIKAMLKAHMARPVAKCEFFQDTREGKDRWGTPYNTKTGCGSSLETACPLYLEESCPGCLAPDEPVWTERGLIPIGQVVVGDVVLGIDGRPDVVIEVTRKHEPLLRLATASARHGMRLTPDHRCFVVPREVAHERVMYLHENGRDLLALTKGRSPVSTLTRSDLAIKRAADVAVGDYWLFPVVAEEGRDDSFALPLDAGFAWLYGLWLGDGWLSKRGLGIAFHSEQTHLLDRAVEQLARLGCHPTVRRRPNRHLTEIEWYSVEMRGIFEEQFGKGAFGKGIPFVALSWSADVQRALIAGYYDADGKKTHKSGSLTAETRSRALADGLYALSIQAGLPVGMTRYDNRGDIWCLTWWWQRRTSKGFFADVDGRQFYWTPVIDVAEDGAATEVVDIGVARTESFVAAMGVTHNCRNPGNRLKPCVKSSCRTECSTCGGGGRAVTFAGCGQERSFFRDDMLEEMEESFLLEAWGIDDKNQPIYDQSSEPAFDYKRAAFIPVIKDDPPCEKHGTWMSALEARMGEQPYAVSTTFDVVWAAWKSRRKARKTIREQLGINADTQLIVTGMILDDALDAMHDERIDFMNFMIDQGIDVFVPPQFSLYFDQPNFMAVYNANRVFEWHCEAIEFGFKRVCFMHPSYYTEWMRQEYWAFAKRTQMQMIAVSIQTTKLESAKGGGLTTTAVQDCIENNKNYDPHVGVLYFGAGNALRMAQAARLYKGRDIAFANVSAYAGAAFYRMYPQNAKAPPGMTKGEVFAYSVDNFTKLAKQAIAKAAEQK
jgi:hypothetical protein